MIEYGHGVGQGTGATGGRSGGGSTDLGGEAVNALADVVDRVAALPPEMLVVLLLVVLAGLFVLKRAF